MTVESSTPSAQISAASIAKTAVEARLIDQVEPILASMGYELVDIEVIERQNGVIRVILGSATTPIGVDDCEKAHRELSPLFDVWDPLPFAYTLELSSPGENPPLRTLEHFRGACGSQIKFQTLEPLPMPAPAKPRKNWQVDLLEVGDEGLLVVKDTLGDYRIPISKIRTASKIQEWKP